MLSTRWAITGYSYNRLYWQTAISKLAQTHELVLDAVDRVLERIIVTDAFHECRRGPPCMGYETSLTYCTLQVFRWIFRHCCGTTISQAD